jgi:endonuclease/exonuclease/phosphatase family metal-dependent hydrolase
VALLVRTWNLFHGDAVPPERRSFLRDMIDLATADDPDVLCLQEVPVWALARLGEWSGMHAFGAVAARPRVGPLPSTGELGRRLTKIDPARLRSLFTGQANAILLARRHAGEAAGSAVLNACRFRRVQARWLRLDLVTRLAWAKERRIVHAVRVRLADGRRALVANLHATGSHDKRLPDAEVRRAAWFAAAAADPDELCVLAGDLNVRAAVSRTLLDLCGPEWGFSQPGPGIDHVLVRGAEATPGRPWPLRRRQAEGRLLSDHAPVEVTIA